MEKPPYDGHLICVVGSDIETMRSVDSFFVDRQAQKTIPFDNSLLTFAAQRDIDKGIAEELQRLDANGEFREIIDYYRSSQGDYERLLQENIRQAQLSPQIIEIILKGRLHLMWLLNSFGGVYDVVKAFQDISANIKKKGGKTSAYVTTTAQSGAANIFSSCDERYVLRSSELMWHPVILQIFENDEERDYEDFLKHIAQERRAGRYREQEQPFENRDEDKKIHDFFSGNALPEKRDELLNMFYNSKINPDNPKKEMRLHGDKLSQFGLVTAAYADVRTLMEKFQADAGLWPIPKGGALDFFFTIASLEEMARVRYNARIKFIVEPQSRTTTGYGILDGTSEDAQKAIIEISKFFSGRS